MTPLVTDRSESVQKNPIPGRGRSVSFDENISWIAARALKENEINTEPKQRRIEPVLRDSGVDLCLDATAVLLAVGGVVWLVWLI